MSQIARMMILVGIALVIVGGALLLGSRIGLGKLPGDFVWRRGNATFYFPLATSLLLSLVLSVLFWLLRR